MKQGQRLILRVDEEHAAEDIRCDVLKSDTASVFVVSKNTPDLLIPEINLELESGTLGGMYTEAEGWMA